HVVQLRKLEARVFEFDQFRAGGVVLLPGRGDEPTSGVDALRACLAHAAEAPDERAIITGHAASSNGGSAEKLSGLRAAGLHHLLAGARDSWAQAMSGAASV